MRFVSFFGVLACALVGCSREEWVERQIPETTPPTREVTPTPVAEQADARVEVEAPRGWHEVTFDMRASRVGHVSRGAFVDLFITHTSEPDAKTGLRHDVGMLAFQDLHVAQKECDGQACSLTVNTTDPEGLLAVVTRHEEGLHLWVRPEEAVGRGEAFQLTLFEGLVELEFHQEAHTRYVEGGRTSPERRRVSVELALSSRAASRLSEGMEGKLIGVVHLDERHHLVLKEIQDIEAKREERGDTLALTLLQKVRLERVRQEGERVVIEVEVESGEAGLLTLAGHGASRVDFVPTRPDEEVHEVRRRRGKETLIEAQVYEHPIRRPRKRRVKRDEE